VPYAIGADAPNLPSVGGFVQLPQAWHSSAGIIQNLVEHACGGVAVLHSRKGETRANHWHKTDWHYLYVLSGFIEYEEWPHDKPHPLIAYYRFLGRARALEPGEAVSFDDEVPSIKLSIGPGQMVFTPPQRSHKLTFKEDTVMISISKLSRTHAEHESDVVRL